VRGGGIRVGLHRSRQRGGQVQHPARLQRLVVIQPPGQGLGGGHRTTILRHPVQKPGGIPPQISRIPQPHRIVQLLGAPAHRLGRQRRHPPHPQAFGHPHHRAKRGHQPQQHLPTMLRQPHISAVQLPQQRRGQLTLGDVIATPMQQLAQVLQILANPRPVPHRQPRVHPQIEALQRSLHPDQPRVCLRADRILQNPRRPGQLTRVHPQHTRDPLQAPAVGHRPVTTLNLGPPRRRQPGPVCGLAHTQPIPGTQLPNPRAQPPRLVHTTLASHAHLNHRIHRGAHRLAHPIGAIPIRQAKPRNSRPPASRRA
jgi:hypothetical protein